MAHEQRPDLRPWKVLDEEVLLSVPPWLSVQRQRVQLPTERILDDFYRVVLPDFATVMALTPAGEFILVRGYKHGIGQVTLSVPAGFMQPEETPLHAAQRELVEETGYEATEWRSLGHFVVDGNRQCGTMHLFAAYDAHPVRPPQQEESEQLQIELLRREQVVAALQSGEMTSLAGAATIALGLLLAPSRARSAAE